MFAKLFTASFACSYDILIPFPDQRDRELSSRFHSRAFLPIAEHGLLLHLSQGGTTTDLGAIANSMLLFLADFLRLVRDFHLNRYHDGEVGNAIVLKET